MESVLKVSNLRKSYATKNGSIDVLRGVDMNLKVGETAAIVGPSGSGKTTLLSLCAGLDTPDQGDVELLGHPLGSLSEDQRALLRNRHIGFIFQSFHLMTSLTALENVLLPAELDGRNCEREALVLLKRVGLEHRIHHYPAQLSGGEQQRVAIARAFISQPKILFADEPTGNLDRQTCDTIVDLIFELNRDHQTTLVLITHDSDLAQRTGYRFFLRDGQLEQQTQPKEISLEV